MTEPALTLPEARALAQRLADETEACHIICHRRTRSCGYEVLDRRQASSDDFGDTVEYRYPGEKS